MRALARYTGSSTPTVSTCEFTACPPSFRRRRDPEAAGRVLVLVPLRPVDVDLFPVDLTRRAGLSRGGHDQLPSPGEAPAPLLAGTRPRGCHRAVGEKEGAPPVSPHRDFRPSPSHS